MNKKMCNRPSNGRNPMCSNGNNRLKNRPSLFSKIIGFLITITIFGTAVVTALVGMVAFSIFFSVLGVASIVAMLLGGVENRRMDDCEMRKRKSMNDHDIH